MLNNSPTLKYFKNYLKEFYSVLIKSQFVENKEVSKVHNNIMFCGIDVHNFYNF